MANTGVFVNGVAGQNLAASTTYWIFCFDNSGVLTADFRTAATHATSTTAGNEGTEILTGDDTRSLIGMCRINASSQFFQDSQNIAVLSWFNRRTRGGQGVFTASRSTISTTLVEVSTEIRVNFLCWSDHPVGVSLSGVAYSSASTSCYTATSVDGTLIEGSSVQAVNQAGIGSSVIWPPSSEGWHYATLFGAVNSGTANYAGAAALTTVPATGSRCSVSVTLQG